MIEALREDMPEIVYSDFLLDALEPEGICYRIEVPERKRFSPVEGYRIAGNMEINGKICSISFGAGIGEYMSDQCSFEYRTAKGHFNKIERALSFGYLAFGVDGQRYWMQCQPSRTNRIMTEEDRKEIDEYLLNLAHQIIDMKIEGDTIGKE